MKNKRNLAYINELKLLSLPTCLGISYIRLQSILISSPVSPLKKIRVEHFIAWPRAQWGTKVC